MSKIVWNCSLESRAGHKQIIVPFKNVVLNVHPVKYESVCIVAKYHDLANYRLLYSPEILARDRVPGGEGLRFWGIVTWGQQWPQDSWEKPGNWEIILPGYKVERWTFDQTEQDNSLYHYNFWRRRSKQEQTRSYRMAESDELNRRNELEAEMSR